MASQWGMVTTAQAMRMGVSRSQLSHAVSEGRLERVIRGVYRSSEAPIEPKESLYAYWLVLYPSQTAEERIFAKSYDAVVSLETAAWLHGLGNFVPEPYRFSVGKRKQTRFSEIQVRLKSYPQESITICEGLPTTTIEQTIADLVEDHADLSLVSDMVTYAPTDTLQQLNFACLRDLLSPFAEQNGFARGDGQALMNELFRPFIAGQKSDLKPVAASLINSDAFKNVIQSVPQVQNVIAKEITQAPIWNQIVNALAEQINPIVNQMASSLSQQELTKLISAISVGANLFGDKNGKKHNDE